jgi:hypothetical protein
MDLPSPAVAVELPQAVIRVSEDYPETVESLAFMTVPHQNGRRINDPFTLTTKAANS